MTQDASEICQALTVYFVVVQKMQENNNAELPAASMKLIHSGKVLKDEDVLSSVGIKENDFLVVMIAKKKATPKTPAPAKKEEAKTEEAPAAAATPAPAAASSTTPAAAGTTSANTATAAATTTPAPSTGTTTNPPAAPTQPAISDAAVENLTGMGFPEESVRHCLRVAQGNPDLAVEFLTNGIPEGMEQAMQAAASRGDSGTPGNSGGGSGQPLQALRNHPQFNDLRRLVQSNPQMLQRVLTQIGQQQPDLLREISANQALFLQIMNEPIQEGGGGSGSSNAAPAAPTAGSSSAPAAGDNPLAGGMGNPLQMAQMIQSMNPEELGQMAQMMGVSTEQLRATAQMIGQMPPEQLNQFIMQAMGGGGGMEGMFGGGEGGDGAGGGGGGGGPQVLRLTDEEMAAVDRLTEMGFDRAEAAQAFLACDKNEALAANLLMDSMMGDDSGGNQGGGGSGGGGGNSGNNNGGGDDDEDMYD